MTITPAQQGWTGSYAYDSTTQIATLTSTNGWHTFCWNVSSIPEGQEFIVEFDYYFTDLTNKSSTGVFTRMADDSAYGTPIDQLDITATTDFVHYKGTYTGGKKYFGINVRGNDNTGKSIVMKMKNLEIYYIK